MSLTRSRLLRQALTMLLIAIALLATGATLRAQGLAQGGPADPVPTPDYTPSSNVIVLRLNFEPDGSVSLGSARVVAGKPSARAGDPPQLRLKLRSAEGRLIEEYNAWDPRRGTGHGALAQTTTASGRFIVPFSADLSTVEVIDQRDQRTLTTVDVATAAIQPFCRQQPQDPACAQVPPDPRVTAGLEVLYTFGEGGGVVVNDLAGKGAPLHLRVPDPSKVRWSEGRLSIEQSTLISSLVSAERVGEAVGASGEISLEAWVQPAQLAKLPLPRPIVSIGDDLFHRNLTLWQEGTGATTKDGYRVRLRTTVTGLNARQPDLKNPVLGLGGRLIHLVYTRDATGEARLYIDGVDRGQRTVKGAMTNWDPSYRLTLGNELAGDRPWIGSYDLIAIYSRALTPAEVAQNFTVGSDGR